MNFRVRRTARWGGTPVVQQRSRRARFVVLAALSLASCATYETVPIESAALLAALRAVTLESVAEAQASESSAETALQSTKPSELFDPSDGLTVEEAASLAVTLNPNLRAQWANAGVAQAQLVEAGLLPDPSVQWDFSDAQLDLLIPLLRPDERGAQIGAAEARIGELSWSLMSAEWALKRDVQLAFLDVLAAVEQRALNERLQEVAGRSQDFFERARQQGAATALQETSAAIQAGEVRLEGARLRFQERQARQALNALLGLPPDMLFVLQADADLFTAKHAKPAEAAMLTDLAVKQRPDLRELLATYERAEQAVRLAVAQQWPQWLVGTQVAIGLPFLSRFNQAAIETARERREQLRWEVDAAIHKLRAEVHESVVLLDLARGEVEFFEIEIEPRLLESVRLTAEAFSVRQVTAGEILIAQSQVLAARQRVLQARIAHARARTIVTWVTGDKSLGNEP